MPSRRPLTFSPGDFSELLSLDDTELPFEDDDDEDSDPPTYSGPLSRRRGGRSRTGRTEHTYTINNTNEHPWMTLKVKSWASSKNSLPVFIEGQSIEGIVELDLRKSDSINAINVTLVGRVEFSRLEHKTFLTTSETVWDSSKGDPRSPTPTPKPYTKKLQGTYSWPFTMNIPQKVYRTTKHAKALMLQPIEDLPPYFDGKGWRPSIIYELSLDVKRSGPFRLGSTLSTFIAYTPCITPDPPSPLRQLAYMERSPIPGPEIDPEGWKVFPVVVMQGTVFNNREATVYCSLAFATPMTYTRGTAIPLVLTLQGHDAQALDLLSHPEAPVVRMRRKMNAPVAVFDDEAAGCSQPGAEGYRPISKAGWWHPEEFIDESDSTKRTLFGELTIPNHLTPSFKFGSFELWYAVDMLPFKIAGFVPATSDRLFRTDIKVATNYARGPKPTARLPPGYIGTAKRGNVSRGF